MNMLEVFVKLYVTRNYDCINLMLDYFIASNYGIEDIASFFEVSGLNEFELLAIRTFAQKRGEEIFEKVSDAINRVRTKRAEGAKETDWSNEDGGSKKM